jgi:hypothetical protein
MEHIKSDFPCFEISCKLNQDIQAPFLALAKILLRSSTLTFVGPPVLVPEAVDDTAETSAKERAAHFQQLLSGTKKFIVLLFNFYKFTIFRPPTETHIHSIGQGTTTL